MDRRCLAGERPGGVALRPIARRGTLGGATGPLRGRPDPTSLHQLGPSALLQLQRDAGNAAVAGVVSMQRTGGGAVAHATVHMGAKGPQVTALQQALNAAGAGLVADGAFGPATMAALKSFQRAAGLVPDGVAGMKTWSALDSGGVSVAAGAGVNTAAAAVNPLHGAVAAKVQQLQAALATMRAGRSVAKGAAQEGVGEATPTAAPSVTGAWGKDSWLDDASDWVSDAAGTVTDAAAGAAGWVGDQASSAADWVGDTASETASWVEDKVGAAADWVGDKAGEAAGWAEQKVAQAGQWVAQKGAEVVQGAGHLLDEGVAAVSAAVEDVKGFVAELDEDLQGALGPMYGKLKDVLHLLANPSQWGPALLGVLNDLIGRVAKLLPGGDGKELGEEDEEISGDTGAIRGGRLAGAAGCDEPRLDLNLSLDPRVERGAPTRPPAALDSISANVNFTSSVIGGEVHIPPTAHGYAEPTFNLAKGLWKARTSWDVLYVDAPMQLDVRWNIQSRGRDAVRRATDDVVHAGSYKEIIRDLTPNSDGKPQRDSYWVPGITQEHELFHADDYIARAKEFMATAQEWLNGQQIDIHWYTWDKDKVVNARVREILTGMEKMFSDDCMAHLKAGGEERAYKATRGGYDDLISAIRARAATEGWN